MRMIHRLKAVTFVCHKLVRLRWTFRISPKAIPKWFLCCCVIWRRAFSLNDSTWAVCRPVLNEPLSIRNSSNWLDETRAECCCFTHPTYDPAVLFDLPTPANVLYGATQFSRWSIRPIRMLCPKRIWSCAMCSTRSPSSTWAGWTNEWTTAKCAALFLFSLIESCFSTILCRGRRTVGHFQCIRIRWSTLAWFVRVRRANLTEFE